MKLINALNKLLTAKQSVLRTQDAAMILGISRQHASQLLRRLSQENSIIPLKKGLWLIDKKMNAYQLPPYLISPFPCYFSLYTALYLHGMISQIPDTLYVITVGRTQRLHTSIADYSFHHVNPDFFFGFSTSEENYTPLATPEKAFIDTLYFIPTKSKRFHSLPELVLTDNFDIKIARKIIARIPSIRTRHLVKRLFETICQSK